MDLNINWLAVLLATAAGMLIAGVWYTNATFGPAWRRLTGISEKDSQKAGNAPMLLALAANAVTAVALAVLIHLTAGFFNNYSVWLALVVGLLAWLAFSATTLATHNAFEQKSTRLTHINNGYQLVLFLSMSLVIGLFGR